MVQCAYCRKGIPEGKKVFEKGKFFDSEACRKKWWKKAAKSPKGKNVCEFC